ncbi:MAG TPA: NrfD/PsrC family molybdoenzyme membrane anchor subunit [Tepidisphaeraceae bacterium]|jgi:molybdopterin-containing oxidoreductase family membrane subunit
MATIYSNPQTVIYREIDNTNEPPGQRAPLVVGGRNFTSITDVVTDVNLKPAPLAWYIGFGISLTLLGVYVLSVAYLLTTGVGVWGNNNSVSWGFPIVNFVFWVGIGHAGTLISAILYLFRQNWRTGINRFAEAMTIFAVVCAGLYPGLHVGRVWMAYWLFPLPNQMALWPQTRSPLWWDVFAVSTYATVSTLFWYVGMLPDLATLRDRTKNRIAQIAYSVASLGWTGSSRHWHRFERAYLLLAALATPLVLSVHSVVSFDFATSNVPGWHTTLFPPYFVAGAIFGGFAMVLVLAIPAREWFGMKDIITLRHLDNCAKIMLATGMIVTYAYCMELFIAWYSGAHYEQTAFLFRVQDGPYAFSFWALIFCNSIVPQLLWIKRFRLNPWTLFLIANIGNIGMWWERFVIVIQSLNRTFLPGMWRLYWPTYVDIAMFVGSFGLFFTLFLLFCRFLPIVAMAEVKSITPESHAHPHDPDQQVGAMAGGDFRPDENYKPAH